MTGEGRPQHVGLDDGGPRIDSGEGRVEEAALHGGDPRRRVGRVVEETFGGVELQDLVAAESPADSSPKPGVVGSLGQLVADRAQELAGGEVRRGPLEPADGCGDGALADRARLARPGL